MASSKVMLIECMIGVFAFNEQKEIVDVVFFPKRVQDLAEVLDRLQKGKRVDEVITLVERLTSKGYRDLVFENTRLAQTVEETFDLRVSVDTLGDAGSYLRSSTAQLAVDRGFVESIDEYYTLVHQVSLALSRRSVKEASGKKDLMVVQAISIFDDLDKTFNLFANRVREWYGYHFPELGRLVDGSDAYVRLVATLGDRGNFRVEPLTEMDVNPQSAEALVKAAQASMGADLEETDVAEIRSFSQALLGLYASRGRLERYIDHLMGEVAPNIRELVGSTLGARLIAAASGLESLAKKSSSTIQILGAEKALFRSLKRGTRPPKHGLLFQHKDVHQSPRWQRGKIARSLAGKLTIAARLDAYGGKYMGDELVEALNTRVEEIRAKYADPPKKGR